MDPYVRHFIRAAVLWLGLGVLLGLLIAVWPRAIVYRPAHMHANLLGFVSMMIFGVAYHVLPRFVGRPLHNVRLAALHVWLANAGLTLMVTAWLLRPHVPGTAPLLGAGALLSTVGAFSFSYNVWRTLESTPQSVPVVALRPRMDRD